MRLLQLGAILAGICFGIWPLLMKASRLPGNLSSAVFSGGVFLFILPFAIRSGMVDTENVSWLLAIIAAAIGAVGIMSFNGMLAKSTTENVAMLILLMIVVQTATPVIYHAVRNGLTVNQALGVILAIASAFFLTR